MFLRMLFRSFIFTPIRFDWFGILSENELPRIDF